MLCDNSETHELVLVTSTYYIGAQCRLLYINTKFASFSQSKFNATTNAFRKPIYTSSCTYFEDAIFIPRFFFCTIVVYA